MQFEMIHIDESSIKLAFNLPISTEEFPLGLSAAQMFEEAPQQEPPNLSNLSETFLDSPTPSATASPTLRSSLSPQPSTSSAHDSATVGTSSEPEEEEKSGAAGQPAEMLSLVRAASQDIKGSLRKNVYKFVARQLLKAVSRHPLGYYQYIRRYMPLTQENFAELQGLVKNIEKNEKARTSDHCHKDYVKLINCLATRPETLLLLLKSLQDTLTAYNNGKYGRISENNKPIYFRVIQGLCDVGQQRLRDFHL